MGIEFFTGAILGALILGVMICAYTVIFCRRGVFHIDFTDPNKDVCRLEIGPLGDICRRKLLILKINTKTDLSQK